MKRFVLFAIVGLGGVYGWKSWQERSYISKNIDTIKELLDTNLKFLTFGRVQTYLTQFIWYAKQNDEGRGYLFENKPEIIPYLIFLIKNSNSREIREKSAYLIEMLSLNQASASILIQNPQLMTFLNDSISQEPKSDHFDDVFLSQLSTLSNLLYQSPELAMEYFNSYSTRSIESLVANMTKRSDNILEKREKYRLEIMQKLTPEPSGDRPLLKIDPDKDEQTFEMKIPVQMQNKETQDVRVKDMEIGNNPNSMEEEFQTSILLSLAIQYTPELIKQDYVTKYLNEQLFGWNHLSRFAVSEILLKNEVFIDKKMKKRLFGTFKEMKIKNEINLIMRNHGLVDAEFVKKSLIKLQKEAHGSYLEHYLDYLILKQSRGLNPFKELSKAIDHSSGVGRDDPDLFYHLARNYILLNENDLAIKTLHEVLYLHPRYEPLKPLFYKLCQDKAIRMNPIFYDHVLRLDAWGVCRETLEGKSLNKK